ncbi:MAG: hypothetical protein NT099_00315 [Candidatus Saganbacteria bacterium]|nr:hypothetical protein [Candidatus Saganbacteria bacterium]
MAQDTKKERSHYEIVSVGSKTYQNLIYGQDAMRKMTANKTEGNFVRTMSDTFLKHKEARQVYRLG